MRHTLAIGLPLLVATICLATLYSSTGRVEAQTDEKPNIILFIADDMRADELQFMPKTKELLDGVNFKRAFASGTTCCPTRATILTGDYLHTHRVLTNGPVTGGLRNFRKHEGRTIAATLNRAGYETMLAGKYLNGYHVGRPYVPQGWDEWRGWYNGSQTLSEDGTPTTQNTDKWQRTKVSENGEVVTRERHMTDYITDEAVNLISDESRQDPVFTYLSFSGPHTPSIPPTRYEGRADDEKLPRPPSFNEKNMRDKPPWLRGQNFLKRSEVLEIQELHQGRVESLMAIDDSVERVVEAVEEAGEMDNTYFIFTSDQGHRMGEHRLPPQKMTPFEEDIRIPLLVAGPDTPQREEGDMVLNNDFAPTMASLAGSRLADRDGRSLVSLLDANESNDVRARNAVLTEKWGRRITPSDFKLVRTPAWKYVKHANGQRELYNVKRDPYELDNVYSKAGKAVKNKLSLKLNKLENCQDKSCWGVENRR